MGTASSARRRTWAVLVGVGGLLLAVAFAVYWTTTPTARKVALFDEHEAAALPAGAQPLRLLVAAMTSPRWTADRYSALVDWLGRRLGRPVTLVQRKSYFEGNEALRHHEVDVAFVCSGAFAESRRDGGYADLLVVPVVGGAMTYQSYVIALAHGPLRSFEDLRGHSMAFTDPLSLTGRLYVRHRLAQAGVSDATFFSRVTYTGSHDRSIDAVLDEVVDAAAVDGLVYDAFVERTPSLELTLRIIDRSPPFGIPPVVVPHDSPPELRRELLQALTGMHADSEGRAVLESLGIDRFEVARPEAYASLEEYLAR